MFSLIVVIDAHLALIAQKLLDPNCSNSPSRLDESNTDRYIGASMNIIYFSHTTVVLIFWLIFDLTKLFSDSS